jgi:hypothetical protein
MRWIAVVLLFVLIPFFSDAQKKLKYTHKYDIHLKLRPSEIVIDSSQTSIDSISQLIFWLKDFNGHSLEQQTINLTGTRYRLVTYRDSLLRFTDSKTEQTAYTDTDGKAICNVEPGTYSASLFGLNIAFSISNFQVRKGFSYAFRVVPGNFLAGWATIYSSRRLTKEEVEQITDDVSFGRPNNLIDTNLCYLMFWV